MPIHPDALRSLQQEQIRLREQVDALHDELTTLRDAIAALNHLDDQIEKINTQSDVFALIRDILMQSLFAVNSENGSLILLDKEAQELVFVAAIGAQSDKLTGLRMPAKEGIVGSVVKSCQSRLVGDVRLEPLWSALIDERLGFHTVSLVCVPVYYNDQVWGAIEVVNTRTGKAFTQQDVHILQLVARLAALALANAEQNNPAL